MTSHYERNLEVPPASVEHLGRHRRSAFRTVSPLLSRPSVADEPTYDDFLEPDEAEADLPEELG